MKIYITTIFAFLSFFNSYSQSKLLPGVIQNEVIGLNHITKKQIKGQTLNFSKSFENVIIDSVNNVYIITFKVDEVFNREAIAVFDIEKSTLLWERTYNLKFNDFTFFDEFVLLRTRGKTIKVDIHTGKELWTIENMFIYGSDKFNIGIFYKNKFWSGKNIVEGIDLNTGSTLWTRNDLDMHGSRIIDVEKDSLITIFEKNSIQNFNLFSGKGWQKYGIALANYCIHSANSTTCYNTTKTIEDSTGYLIALSNKLLKINKKGEEIWHTIYPNELQCSLPKLSIIDSSIYLLNNGGGALSDVFRFNENYSPFFGKYDLNGNQKYFKKFDKKQIITDFIFSKDTLTTLHRKSLTKTESKLGETVFEYQIKGKEKSEIGEFIGFFTYAQMPDSSFVRLSPSDSTGYKVYDNEANIRHYSKKLDFLSERKVGDYWNLNGGFKGNLFLRNVDKFVIIDKSLNQVANFDNYKRGIVKQGKLYLMSNNRLTKVDFKEIIETK